MAKYLKETITAIISIISSFVLIGGLTIGTKAIDKAKKLNAIRTCRGQLIKYKESSLMSFIVLSDLKEEKGKNLIKPINKGFFYKVFDSYSPIGLGFKNKKFIAGVPISKYSKLIDPSNQFYKIMQFDFQIFANTYLYNCISERNLFVLTSRKVKAKNTLDNNNLVFKKI